MANRRDSIACGSGIESTHRNLAMRKAAAPRGARWRGAVGLLFLFIEPALGQVCALDSQTGREIWYQGPVSDEGRCAR
jgi:hypothetical protein